MKKSLIITLGLAIMFALSSVTMGITGAVISAKAASGPVVPMVSYAKFVQVSAGESYSLALDEIGRVWAWGNNVAGQLGDGTTAAKNTPVRVSDLTEVTAISAGRMHSMALKSDNTVWVWGNNASGQLGDGTKVNKNTPVQVLNLIGVTAISAGYSHSMALKSDGTVWAWGDNDDGQLGDGTTVSNYSAPIHVQGLTGIIAISAGSWHSMALQSDGTVWAWGNNSNGELGDGTTVRRSRIPVSVLGGGRTVISAGNVHSMSVYCNSNGDGSFHIYAWGSNNYGQLGNGTTDTKNTPVSVLNMARPAEHIISAGGWHSMALDSDGDIITWGSNQYGQLGNGTTDDRLSPLTLVPTLTDAIAISAGSSHSMAIKSDGSVWTWGGNAGGQLGDGTTVNKLTPIKVIEISLMEDAIVRLEETISDLQSQLSTQSTALTTLLEIINGKEGVSAGMLSDLTNAISNITALQSTINTMSANLNKIKTDYDSLVAEGGSLVGLNDEISELTRDLETHINSAITISDVQDAIATAIGQLDYVSQAEYDELKQELEKIKAQLVNQNSDGISSNTNQLIFYSVAGALGAIAIAAFVTVLVMYLKMRKAAVV